MDAGEIQAYFIIQECPRRQKMTKIKATENLVWFVEIIHEWRKAEPSPVWLYVFLHVG